jgi:lytic murein transglycosylase
LQDFAIPDGQSGPGHRAAGADWLRPLVGLLLALCVALVAASAGAVAQDAAGFQRFVKGLWPDVQAKGISRATFDKAFQGVEPNFAIPDLVLPGKPEPGSGQAEFTKTPAEYVNAAYLAKLADQGKSLLTKHAEALGKIEEKLGVQRQFVLAIWGRETAFGQYAAPHYAIQVLATQAYTGRRKELFRNELLNALQMLQDGVVTRENMKSSWAGAMGLTQFLPSEYNALAVDMDGDGRKDIWNSIPDALASTANQLKARGWMKGHPWAIEVRLPPELTCRMEGPPNARSIREWAKLGVVRSNGRAFPGNVLDADAFVLTAGGAYGPAFLALENFMVLKRYNMSDLYAIFVGNLADRIAGGANFDTPWGDVRQLSARGIEEIQKRLKARGYAIEKYDGKAGMNTRALIGAYQQASGLKIDCWPSEALLTHLRSTAAAESVEPASAKGTPTPN